MVHRTPVLTQAFAHVAERYGKSVAMTLFEVNPKSVLSGDLVDTLGPETSARQKWWQWWSR
jgi:tyrosine-protein phosphatase YwqE